VHPLDILETVLATKGPAGVNKPLHIQAADLSITNLAEFAAIRRSWWEANGADLASVLTGDLEGLGALDGELLATRQTEYGEVHSVPTVNGLDPGDPFSLFQERFKTAMLKGGAQTDFAYGIVGALHEMAGNAIEHAGPNSYPVATFEIRPSSWAFSVTDLGVGVWVTLKRNPSFVAIATDVAALQTAVRDGVSGTGKAGRGFGFTQVFKSLADRSCSIRFRTVGALANWAGVSPAAQRLELSPMPARRGFHVAVSGSLAKNGA
jgi:hypothetical protein